MDAGFDNTQLAFQKCPGPVQAYYEVRDEKGYLTFQDHDTTRDGYYFTNGKESMLTGKSGDYDPTKFYDDDGNEIWS